MREHEQQGVRHRPTRASTCWAWVSLSGPDVSTDTSGHQDEYFDQQANSTDIRWTINDTFSMKYIFGYTDYFYDRTSDVDLTSNTDAFTLYSGDQQFYVSQETEYVSHELQFFNDWNDSLTTTTGLFYYKAEHHAARRLLRLELERPLHAGLRLQSEQCRRTELHRRVPPGQLFTAKQDGLIQRGGGLASPACVPLSADRVGAGDRAKSVHVLLRSQRWRPGG